MDKKNIIRKLLTVHVFYHSMHASVIDTANNYSIHNNNI